MIGEKCYICVYEIQQVHIEGAGMEDGGDCGAGQEVRYPGGAAYQRVGLLHRVLVLPVGGGKAPYNDQEGVLCVPAGTAAEGVGRVPH